MDDLIICLMFIILISQGIKISLNSHTIRSVYFINPTRNLNCDTTRKGIRENVYYINPPRNQNFLSIPASFTQSCYYINPTRNQNYSE